MPTVEIAACQVHVTAGDYASAARFEALLERVGRRLDAARARRPDGAFAHECLAVFPEMIGAFLPLAGRSEAARRASTMDGALARVALRSLPAIARAMRAGRTLSPTIGLLLAAAPGVRALYAGAFRRFAIAHSAWVVAGSALLPRNALGDLADAFEPDGGRVYNTSYTFAPDGRLAGCARKVNLVPTLEDTLGLSPGSPAELRPVEAPFGRVGTMICYDGFYVPHTRREPGFRRLARHYDDLGCAVLAQPAANPWPWDGRWAFAEPGEVQLRREQWESEGLLAQLRGEPLCAVRYAATAQLLGQVFENRFEGRSHLLARDASGARVLAEAARADAAPEAEEVVLRAVEIHA